MDTVSQIALGAAVGEAVAGKEAGRKAAIYGAIGGIIPDLDILLYPMLDEVQRLGVHRGFSHSIFFGLLLAPLCGWLLRKLHPKSPVSARRWGVLAFVALFTHPLLDYFTIYGTQLLNPVSDTPFELGSIFIIDPLYTLPLILGLLAAFFTRNNPARRQMWNRIGLTLSTLYLALGITAKFTAQSNFERALQEQGLRYDRIFTGPTPFNTILWTGMAEDVENDRLLVGLYSLLDDGDRKIEFRAVPKRSPLIADVLETRPLQRLMWFSRGWYQVEQKGDAVIFNDLRFGRSDGWLSDRGSYIFVFELIADPAGSRNFVSMQRNYANVATGRSEALGRLLDRMLGRSPSSL